jgi:hypothetical protein
MGKQRTSAARANALKDGQELVVRLEGKSGAPAEIVYDVVADLRGHLVWAGEMQPKQNFRLSSIEAPEGLAAVGTEFRSTGADPMGRFTDSSVVTEAEAPRLLEFVTEARLDTKKGKTVHWTNIHRYEIEPAAGGCHVKYTIRIVRLSALPGSMSIFKAPILSGIGLKVSASYARRGLRNLLKLAQERSASR